jgi:feruloyl esterase
VLNDSIYEENRLYEEAGMSFMTPPKATHLQRLWQRGSRMIVYHGVSDPIFSADDTTEWFNRVTPRGQHSKGHGPSPDAFVRLFHVPGMNHCSGGPATDQFDLLSALVAWVEKGEAPERVVARARGAGNPGGVNTELPAGWAPDRTRPLCSYPGVATYQGGNPERAESFSCK